MDWEQGSRTALTDAQFARWQALLEARTGMYVSVERKSLLQSNLSIRMREIGFSDVDDYYAKVAARPAGVMEWNILLDRIMVQETRFYRNPESLQLFADIVAQHLRDLPAASPLNVWSVGCSTGEEPYTLAMSVHQALTEAQREINFGVTATDISLPALGKAREGLYGRRKLLDLPQEWISHYMEECGDDTFRVNDELRRRVCFTVTNMIEISKSPLRNMHVIYCQNVLIYFRRERIHQILDALVERLAPNGVLIIGQGEATSWVNEHVERVSDSQTLAFRRRAATQPITH